MRIHNFKHEGIRAPENQCGNRVARKRCEEFAATLMFEISSAILQGDMEQNAMVSRSSSFGRDHCDYCNPCRPSCCRAARAKQRPECRLPKQSETAGVRVGYLFERNAFIHYIRRQLFSVPTRSGCTTLDSVRWRPGATAIMPDSIIFLNLARLQHRELSHVRVYHSCPRCLPYGNELCLWRLWLQQRRLAAASRASTQILLYSGLGDGVDVNGKALPCTPRCRNWHGPSLSPKPVS